MSSQKITRAILVCMILGIGVGFVFSKVAPDPETAKSIVGYCGLITDILLRLSRMIIAPLVFATLVSGIAHMGGARRSAGSG